MMAGAGHAKSGYLGEKDWVIVDAPGCNPTAPVQIPGFPDLFINRTKFAPDGQLVAPAHCRGAQWSLTLNRMDWSTHKLHIIKTLLDTTVDPETGQLRNMIRGGPRQGASLRSAYDADIVLYRGLYLVSFGCWLRDDVRYGVSGSSSCITVYDPSKQEFDMDRAQVIVSGYRVDKRRFISAGVPHLLVFHDRLFVYWSAVIIDEGKFARNFLSISIRGAELELNSGSFAVKGSGGRVVHSIDEPLTTEVWAPDPNDPLADNMVDLLPL